MAEISGTACLVGGLVPSTDDLEEEVAFGVLEHAKGAQIHGEVVDTDLEVVRTLLQNRVPERHVDLGLTTHKCRDIFVGVFLLCGRLSTKLFVRAMLRYYSRHSSGISLLKVSCFRFYQHGDVQELWIRKSRIHRVRIHRMW